MTVANNELGAGWCQGCCEYTQGSFAVTCIMFTVNLWAIIKMLYYPPHHIFNPSVFYRDQSQPARTARASLTWLGDAEEADGVFSLDEILKPLPRGLSTSSPLATNNQISILPPLSPTVVSDTVDVKGTSANLGRPQSAVFSFNDLISGGADSVIAESSIDALVGDGGGGGSSAAGGSGVDGDSTSVDGSSGGGTARPPPPAAMVAEILPAPVIKIAPAVSPRRPMPRPRLQTQPVTMQRPQLLDSSAEAGEAGDIVPAEMLPMSKSKTMPGRLSGDLLLQFNQRYGDDEDGDKAGKEREHYKNEMKALDGHAFVLANPLRPSHGRRGRRSSMDISLLNFETDA